MNTAPEGVSLVHAVEWREGMAFEAQPAGGHGFTLDAHPDFGGTGQGPTPLEALLCSVAACSAMDVVSVLKKKHQPIATYRVEVDYDRASEGDWPRPLLAVRLRHLVTGEGLDEAAVAHAVELSDAKYCTLVASLRAEVKVETTFEVASLEAA